MSTADNLVGPIVEFLPPFNVPRPTTGKRRSRSDIKALKEALYWIIASDKPMTVRQVFYRAVSAGLINKTETEYKATIVRLLGEMAHRRRAALLMDR